MFHTIARSIGAGLARFLNQSTGDYEQFSVTPEHRLKEVLRPGDILLVEGKTRICHAIGISDEDRGRIVDFVCSHLGHRYDLKNIFDLSPYFRVVRPTLELGFD